MPKHESRTLISSRIPRGTSGSVLFIDANGRLAQNNSQLFWDNINNRLGIGTTGPGARLDVVGPIAGFGITIRASGDVVLGTGGSLFFDNNYSYATGNYIRPLAANTQAFFTAGTERMRITPAGNVGIGTTAPHASASLDITSTTRGFLPPRMTTVQRDAILTPAAGLMIFNSTTSRLNFHDGVAWREISSV